MKKGLIFAFTKHFFCLCLLITNAAAQTKSADLESEVKMALTAVKSGNYDLLANLKNRREAIIPYLTAYQEDESLEVRRSVVWLLKHIVSEKSIPLLARGLIDKNATVSADAARTLYEFYTPQMFVDNRTVAANLREAVKNGNQTTAALLLLSNFPDTETTKVLETIVAKKDLPLNQSFMKLPAVAPSLPANIALLRSQSDDAAAKRILQVIKTGERNDLEFFLQTLSFIEDKKILRELFQKTIIDNRIIQPVTDGKVPDKNNLARMKDLAVVRFVQKLMIEVSFPVKPNFRFISKQTIEAQRKINARLIQK